MPTDSLPPNGSLHSVRASYRPATGASRTETGLARREADLDAQASLGLRAALQVGAVGGGDRLDDREAEAGPVRARGAFRLESLEGLEEALDLAGRDHRPRVRDGAQRPSGSSAGRDLDAAVREIVLDRVVDEVRDEPLHETRIAVRRGRLQLGLHGQA